MPYSPTSGRSGRRTGSPRLRTRANFTGTQRLAALRPSFQRHRAPVPQPNHAHEDYSPSRSRCQIARPPRHTHSPHSPGNSVVTVERPPITAGTVVPLEKGKLAEDCRRYPCMCMFCDAARA
eukprot:scaffold95594_cov69-Phaeocystis_antarctica.AAC.1